MTRDNAISTAITTCINKDILKKFLTEHYVEVLKMLNWEYNEETHKRVIAEESRQEGLKEGRQVGATLMAKLLKEGMNLDDALKHIAKSGENIPPTG